MELIKFGHKYVNMDLVTDIQIKNDTLTFFFAAAVQNGLQHILKVEDKAQVEALQKWLDENSEVVKFSAENVFAGAV